MDITKKLLIMCNMSALYKDNVPMCTIPLTTPGTVTLNPGFYPSMLRKITNMFPADTLLKYPDIDVPPQDMQYSFTIMNTGIPNGTYVSLIEFLISSYASNLSTMTVKLTQKKHSADLRVQVFSNLVNILASKSIPMVDITVRPADKSQLPDYIAYFHNTAVIRNLLVQIPRILHMQFRYDDNILQDFIASFYNVIKEAFNPFWSDFGALYSLRIKNITKRGVHNKYKNLLRYKNKVAVEFSEIVQSSDFRKNLKDCIEKNFFIRKLMRIPDVSEYKELILSLNGIDNFIIDPYYTLSIHENISNIHPNVIFKNIFLDNKLIDITARSIFSEYGAYNYKRAKLAPSTTAPGRLKINSFLIIYGQIFTHFLDKNLFKTMWI